MAQRHITIFVLAVLAAFAAMTSDIHASTQDGGPDAQFVKEMVRAYRVEHAAAIMREFAELLSIPNVAADRENIGRNAEHIAAMMRRRGIEARLLQFEGAPPLVYGELNVPGASRTVAIYAHYDGQPVVPEDWDSGPWEPVLRDAPLEEGGEVVPWDSLGSRIGGEWRIYARSAGDDKAPVIAWMAAIDALNASGIPLSVNLKFFFEGEEEAGSPNLEQILEENIELLKTDLLLLCDGPVHQSRRMQLFFGARGIIGLEMTVYGPKLALHSGHYGNWAPNPAAMLSSLLASMRGPDGRVLVEGFYDAVRPLSDSERRALAAVPDADDDLRKALGLARSEAGGARLVEQIMLPALNLRGIQSGQVGSRAKNAIPTEARASIDFRLVPDLTPEIVRALVEAHIVRQGYQIVREDPDTDTRLAYPKIARLRWGRGYPPARTSMDLPVCGAVIRVIEEATEEPLVVMPTLGGSVPLHLFMEMFKAPVIGLPIANHDDNQHAPNENLRVRNLWEGIEVYAAVLARLGHGWD